MYASWNNELLGIIRKSQIVKHAVPPIYLVMECMIISAPNMTGRWSREREREGERERESQEIRELQGKATVPESMETRTYCPHTPDSPEENNRCVIQLNFKMTFIKLAQRNQKC